MSQYVIYADTPEDVLNHLIAHYRSRVERCSNLVENQKIALEKGRKVSKREQDEARRDLHFHRAELAFLETTMVAPTAEHPRTRVVAREIG